MMTILKFCERHGACKDGRDWAMANCRDMDHAWETLRPDWLLWVATRRGVLDNRTLRLFAVWCARQVQHLMKDPRSIAALDVAERHAHGQATDAELAAARAAAGAVASADARDAEWAASDAARDAAWAASDAARAAASAAAWAAASAASDAARDAAWAASDAARAAASAAALEGQAAWLRANAKPCFEGGVR